MSDTSTKTIEATGQATTDISRSLRLTRLTTWISVAFERLWPLVLPFVLLVGLFCAVAWFGVFRGVSEQARLAWLTVFGLAAIGALSLLRHFRLPSHAEIESRIEASNALRHAPLQVQTDELSSPPDAFAEALWREHRKRMAAQLKGLGSDLPRPNIAAIDKWAVRAVVPLVAVIAFAFSYGPSGGRLYDALHPGARYSAEPPRIDAWITPPTYTGKAPIFLTAQANRETKAYTVPEGSELSLRLTGGAGEETLSYFVDGNERDIKPKDPTAKTADGKPAAQPAPVATAATNLQFAVKVDKTGDIALNQGGDQLERWTFTVTPDRALTLKFAEDPRQESNGALQMRYEIDDDYGATAGTADIALIDPPKSGARPLSEKPEVKLALPRNGGKPVVGMVKPDLTKHFWAGAPVAVTLSATDAAGHTATSDVKKFILPERPFRNPLAKAVIEWRRMIGLDANRKDDVRDMLDAVTLRPEDTIQNPTAFLALMSLRTRLGFAQTDDQMREVAEYMWNIALGIEEGSMSSAEQKLRQAQKALKDAIERGASDEEISKLMQELRQAMNEFLREFAENARKNPNAQQQPFNGQMLSQRDLQKMMDDIENQAKSGNRDQAQALLDQLQNMMDNLQAVRPGQQQQGQNGQQGQMQQEMNKLGDIMRRQQEMMNETHRLEQQRQQGQQNDPNGQPQPGQNGMSQQEFDEAMRQLRQGQGKLQQELEGLQKSLEGMGIKPGQGFGDAGRQMGEAESALGDGQGDRATGHQGQALEALRRGAQDMMRQMQAMQQGDEGEGQEGQRNQRNANRDPLNREMREFGEDDGDSTKVPGEIDAQRARQILDAIRKRLGNSLSPEVERQYLERLLDLQ